jgi:hypothetical protein
MYLKYFYIFYSHPTDVSTICVGFVPFSLNCLSIFIPDNFCIHKLMCDLKLSQDKIKYVMILKLCFSLPISSFYLIFTKIFKKN